VTNGESRTRILLERLIDILKLELLLRFSRAEVLSDDRKSVELSGTLPPVESRLKTPLHLGRNLKSRLAQPSSGTLRVSGQGRSMLSRR